MPYRTDRIVISALLLCAGCDLVFPPGSGPASDARPGDAQLFDSAVDGSPFVDTDGDGVFDDTDNCVDEHNTDQADFEPDGVGDACDNCVMVANDQLDEDDDAQGDACDVCPGMPHADADTDPNPDGVGDACDPNPCDSFDSLHGFHGFVADPAWTSDTGAWIPAGGEVTVATVAETRYVAPIELALGAVMTGFSVRSSPPFVLGVEMNAESSGGFDAVRCVVVADGAGNLALLIETNAGPLAGQAFSGLLDAPSYLILSMTRGGATAVNARCELRSADGAVRAAATANGVPIPGTFVGLYGSMVEAGFAWFEVIRRVNTFPPIGC